MAEKGKISFVFSKVTKKPTFAPPTETVKRVDKIQYIDSLEGNDFNVLNETKEEKKLLVIPMSLPNSLNERMIKAISARKNMFNKRGARDEGNSSMDNKTEVLEQAQEICKSVDSQDDSSNHVDSQLCPETVPCVESVKDVDVESNSVKDDENRLEKEDGDSVLQKVESSPLKEDDGEAKESEDCKDQGKEGSEVNDAPAADLNEKTIKSTEENNKLEEKAASGVAREDRKDEKWSESLEEMAAREILEEVQKFNEERQKKIDSGLVISASKKIKDQESSLEDYENIPVSDFGLAMLRGMGWDPKSGVGKDGKVFKMETPSLRPKGMGLGADKVIAPQKATGKDLNKDLVLKVTSKVRVTYGKFKNLYGTVVGFDDDSSRVSVKLSVASETVDLNECFLQLVSPEEFNKYSKVLNINTYSRYKENEESTLKPNSEIKVEKVEDDKQYNGNVKKETPPKDSDIEVLTPPNNSPLCISSDSEHETRRQVRLVKKKRSSSRSDSERNRRKNKHRSRSDSRDRNKQRSSLDRSRRRDDYKRSRRGSSSDGDSPRRKYQSSSRDRQRRSVSSSDDERSKSYRTKKCKTRRKNSRSRSRDRSSRFTRDDRRRSSLSPGRRRNRADSSDDGKTSRWRKSRSPSRDRRNRCKKGKSSSPEIKRNRHDSSDDSKSSWRRRSRNYSRDRKDKRRSRSLSTDIKRKRDSSSDDARSSRRKKSRSHSLDKRSNYRKGRSPSSSPEVKRSRRSSSEDGRTSRRKKSRSSSRDRNSRYKRVKRSSSSSENRRRRTRKYDSSPEPESRSGRRSGYSPSDRRRYSDKKSRRRDSSESSDRSSSSGHSKRSRQRSKRSTSNDKRRTR